MVSSFIQTLHKLTNLIDIQLASSTYLRNHPLFLQPIQLIYIFQLQKTIMQVQSSGTPFSRLTQSVAQSISGSAISLQSPCSLNSHKSFDCRLKLVGCYLLIQHPNQLPLYLEISYENKFEVLYLNEKQVQSSKIGIRFYDDEARELRVWLNSTEAEKWAAVLGKRMNQKGFHEMFKPIRKLGKGNFATVYQAERLTDHTKFAVKAFLKQSIMTSKNGKQSLINQLTVLRQLNTEHQSNILRLEGVYQSENSIYVVLELLEGKTLFHAIQSRRGLSPLEVKSILSGLLQGLAHMHTHRIMHRDLKPENIMLRGDSVDPVIIDYGLATQSDLENYLFFRCGTPGYVAPEIIALTHSQHTQPVCDIFSLGAIFHLLLARKPLFPGTKFDEVYQKNRDLQMDLDGPQLSSASPNAKSLLKSMLQIKPSNRITAVQALQHPYFSQQEQSDALSTLSQVLTQTGFSYGEDDQGRRALLFY